MLVLRTIEAVRARRRELWQSGARVAFVPTMGALHEGHLRLVDRAQTLANEVWASVFVNPTQFAPGEDLEHYPRDEERDLRLLAERGVALVFAPSVKEIYPRPSALTMDIPSLTQGLCGAHRPGHFQGVLLVVAKLFNIAQPEVAVFGAKDFQQATVIRRMVADLDMAVRIEVVPTVREEDGLAMSSRNAYLSPPQRRAAAVLARALATAAATVEAGERSGARLERLLATEVSREGEVRLQYAAAVHPETLQPVTAAKDRVLLALAAHVGSTRLIDSRLVEVA